MDDVYTDFREAYEQAQAGGKVVSGTLDFDGRPLYFLSEPDADDDTVMEKSFEIRNGRPMGGYEKWLLQRARES